MITTLINADDVEMLRDMEESYRAMQFMIDHPHLYAIQDWLLYAKYWLIDKIVCQRIGHNMVDNGSYAGPDSGHESLVCTRCGYSFDHTYY